MGACILCCFWLTSLFVVDGLLSMLLLICSCAYESASVHGVFPEVAARVCMCMLKSSVVPLSTRKVNPLLSF